MPQNAITAIREAHERLVERLREEAKRLEAGLAAGREQKPLPPDVLLRDREVLLERAKERLAAAREAKAAALARLDQEIRGSEETVKRLEKELAEARKNAGKPGPRGAAAQKQRKPG
jgi:cell division septum initiation protein DivIVA